jgi:CubicO group peptidase (beta-lactamase class C family)
VKLRSNRREVAKWMLSAAISSFPAVKLGATVTAFDHAAAEADFESVRGEIQQAIVRGDATGVAVAVVQGERIVWEEGFGWANREARLEASPHTPFSMASITKPFTATTLMTLVAEGKLSLDEPANRYLPRSKIRGSNGDAEKTTVRLLGAHISGLPGIYESYDAGEANLVPSPDDVLEAYGRLAYPPATCYEYSNIGFAALHAISSAITQTKLGTLMHRRVLAPLGLNNSFFGSDTNRWQNSAARYDADGQLIPHYTTSTPASGELYASAHDLARFAQFNMRHRLDGQTPILSERYLDELHRPAFTGPSGIATTFGWFMGHTASGVPFYFKSGGDPGVANRMCFIPSLNLACAVITNRSNAWELANRVVDEVIAKYLPDWHRPSEDCGFPNKPFLVSPEFQGRWGGSLKGGGANMPVHLNIESSEAAMLTIGTNRTEAIRGMRSEGEAFTGVSAGQIDSPDAIRTGATTLQVKLLPMKDRLVGRVFAIAGDPNVKNVRLPYVVTLRRR